MYSIVISLLQKLLVPAITNLPSAVAAALSSSANPVQATLRGARVIGKTLTHTLLGRAIIVVSLLLVAHITFKHFYTHAERGAWEATVAKKQAAIDEKASIVERATVESQKVKSAKAQGLDALLALVVGTIWKTEPPREVSQETIELLNSTRGPRH